MHFGGCNGRYVVQGVMLCIFNKRQQLWLSYSSRPHTRLSSLFSLSSVGVTPFAGRKKVVSGITTHQKIGRGPDDEELFVCPPVRRKKLL